jgi:hypothetical protein
MQKLNVGFEVLTAVVIKSSTSIFWDVTPCSHLKMNLRFGGTCRILFDPENGDDMFLRKVVDISQMIFSFFFGYTILFNLCLLHYS